MVFIKYINYSVDHINMEDKKYWDNYWVDNKEKHTFFNTLVDFARKYYFARAFAAFLDKNYPVAGKSVCEIGSGSGLTLSYLKEAVKYAQANIKDCKFSVGDAFNLSSIPEKSFDIVYSLGFLEHYNRDEQKKLLAEQSRLARECVFIEVPYNSPHMSLLCYLNRKSGRTTTFSDEELFSPKTFRELGLTGKTKLMPNTFFITIGHFEHL